MLKKKLALYGKLVTSIKKLKHNCPKVKLKKKKHTNFVDMMISKVLCDLRFSLNQPLKLVDD
jgi:hypothetical protein